MGKTISFPVRSEELNSEDGKLIVPSILSGSENAYLGDVCREIHKNLRGYYAPKLETYPIIQHLLISDEVDLDYPVLLKFSTLGFQDNMHYTVIDVRKDGSAISPVGAPIGSGFFRRSYGNILSHRIQKNNWF